MAKPIEPTPVLEGEDAEKLLKEVKEADLASRNTKKEKFLKECKAIYKSTKR